jgi:predicted MPP superfamily phosphohydrolase
MAVFKLIILGIPLLSLAWGWWADRRLRSLGKAGIRVVLGLAVLALLCGFVWVILARRDVITMSLPPTWYALVLLWGLVFLPLLGLPTMFAWAVGTIVRRILKKPGTAALEKSDARKWTRREWLAATAVSLPVIGTFGTTAFCMPRLTRFRVRELTVHLKDLPMALDGMRIAHVTDTHVGKFTRGAVLDEIVATTNKLDADLVLFTGDLIDNTIRDLPVAVKMLQRMRSKFGLFVIEGNHDLFDDPEGFEKGVRDGGLAMLRNQAATVQVRGVPVQLLGIVWHHNEKKMSQDVDAVAALRDPAAFPILLAHHPHAFDRAAELGIPLTLAGHTHGGQVMLTPEVGAGPSMFRYWSGLYQKSGRVLVVGNGTGNWFPLRLNAPAEIIHLTLRSGDIPVATQPFATGMSRPLI